MATSASASVSYFRRRRIDFRLLLVIEPLAFAGAFAGGFFTGHVDDFILKVVFSGVLMVTSYLMFRPPVAEVDTVDCGSQIPLERSLEKMSYRARLPQLMSVSALAGWMSGMIGIAGGVFKIPVMVLLGGVPVSIAIGTSAAMVGMTAVAGLAGHFASGHLSWPLLLPVVIGALCGGQIGPRISHRMRFSWLRKLFALILLLVSLNMLVQTLW